MIDVSYNSVRSGLVAYICQILKESLLDYLPKYILSYNNSFKLSHFYREKNAEKSAVRVGFVTYDKQIHFYNVKVSYSIESHH